jgi:hypothetical protein
MRKITAAVGAVLASLALVMGLGVGQAQAADNVVDGDWCQSACTTLGMGRIDVSVNFDNTNCDAHTQSNCSGANGATVDYVIVKYDESASQDFYTGTHFTVDVWGDGTSAYVRSETVTWQNLGVIGGKRTYRADPSSVDDARRIKMRVFNSASGDSSYYDFSNLNPFGL